MSILRDSVVLITGGTGSFALDAIPALSRLGPREIRAVAHGEYGLFLARQALSDYRVNWQMADIRDAGRTRQVMQGVDFCIHAAALKQIPVCEQFPLEAIQTNVLGTANVVQSARAAGVRCLVSLSADKAAYPVTTYGATKLLSEALVASANDDPSHRFISLRYSNVLGSRGSVLEIFHRQISMGEPLRVFGANMTRFFLTQTDVIQLCLDAFERAAGGEVLVRETRPVRIADLAACVVERAGQGSVMVQDAAEAHERLDAVLLTSAESRQAVRHEDLLIVNRLGREHGWQPAEKVEVRDYTAEDYVPLERSEIVELLAKLGQ
ncbi:MAG: polysaccharide biosynthesis protein [Chloroflexota bacterium]